LLQIRFYYPFEFSFFKVFLLGTKSKLDPPPKNLIG
jgi:hypothetical protein